MKTLIDPIEMRHAAEEATSFLRAIAQEDRLMLLCQLSQGEMSVSELEESLDLHQPSLSQHLGVLRNEGLVNTRRDGKWIYYSIADDTVLAVLKLLYRNFCPA